MISNEAVNRTRIANEGAMKMRELSAASGLSVATIKFYLREGVLHPGRATSATQSEYDTSHLERLRLVRALREVGELPLARIEAVLAAIADDRTPLHDLLGQAHHALGPEPAPPTPETTAARAELVAWVAARGWVVGVDAPAFDALAAALVAFRELWSLPACGPEVFEEYADAAERIARHDLAMIDPAKGRADTVRQAVTGGVVFGEALVALRRLAQEHESHRRFGDQHPDPPKVTSGRGPRSRAARGRTPTPER